MLDILLARMDAETKQKKLQEEQAAATNLRLVYLHKISSKTSWHLQTALLLLSMMPHRNPHSHYHYDC